MTKAFSYNGNGAVQLKEGLIDRITPRLRFTEMFRAVGLQSIYLFLECLRVSEMQEIDICILRMLS